LNGRCISEFGSFVAAPLCGRYRGKLDAAVVWLDMIGGGLGCGHRRGGASLIGKGAIGQGPQSSADELLEKSIFAS